MNRNDMKYFRMLSRIQMSINKSSTYYEAIRNGSEVIVNQSSAEYVIVWYETNGLLSPYYWLAPLDLTMTSLSGNLPVVAGCLREDKAAFFPDYAKDPVSEISTALQGLYITSLVITPFHFGSDQNGCIFYISTREKFTEEDAEVLQILSMLTEMSIQDTNLTFAERKRKDPLLSCRGVTKSYKNGEIVTQVLKGINLDVYEGEFLCFLGESGCGKSTLLNIMGGLDRADPGTLSFMGTEYGKADEGKLTQFRRENVGFIFQSYNLMPNLTARDNLKLIAELVKDSMDPAEALSLVGLSDRANHFPSQLSGGQQQRVSIARALIKKPSIIMADEPTAALDYETSIEVLDTMAKVVKSGTALIMVTHNEEITKMADRIVRFRDGKVHEIYVNNTPVQAKELVW